VKPPLIYPSILSADFSRLGDEIRAVDKAGADGLHLDIMDGHFVPNLTFGPPVVKWIRSASDLPYWAHLMIREPMQYALAFHDAGVDGLTFHPETVADVVFTADRLREMGLGVGVALNPETAIDVLDTVLDRLDRILILTVHPGFGGQKLIPEVLGKIRSLRERLRSASTPPLIEVDGGVDSDTAAAVVDAGADVLIIGNAVFGEKDRDAAIRRFRGLPVRTPAGR
jgi:ribulose-phosphate 3-epimerase